MGFIDRPAREEDFTICNYYTNHSPVSPFRFFLMLNLFTENGRYSLMNLSFTRQDGDQLENREVAWEELPEVLKDYFGLDALPERRPEPLRL